MLSPLHFSNFQIFRNEYGVCSARGETHQIQKKTKAGCWPRLGGSGVPSSTPVGSLAVVPCPPYAHPPAQSTRPPDSSHGFVQKADPTSPPLCLLSAHAARDPRVELVQLPLGK